MITILDNQTVPTNTKQLKEEVQKILDYLGYADFDLGIMLTDIGTIHDYNKKYRHKDMPTDILSFPFHETIKPGEKIQAKTADQKNLGDIIICPDYVLQDLPRWEQSFQKRMRILLIHGICHLLGYDHIKDKDYKIMKGKEAELLAIITPPEILT